MRLAALDDIAELYAARGGEHYGEAVTQIDHAVQSASAAIAHDAAPALVVAALLHDIGHLLAGRAADANHANAGAKILARLFGPTVFLPIALHVAAKRYLCAAEPGYLAALSRRHRSRSRSKAGRSTWRRRRASSHCRTRQRRSRSAGATTAASATWRAATPSPTSCPC